MLLYSLLLLLLTPCFAIQYTTFGPNFTYPLGVAKLKQSFNASMYNNGVYDPSLPVIRIGASWAEVREYSEFAGLENFLAYMIDLINFRGGVWLNVSDPTMNPTGLGQRYYLSLTFAPNDASTNYMKLIYNDLALQANNSRTSALFSTIPDALVNAPMPIVLAPPYDQLTVLSPFVRTFNQTYLAVSNPDPSSFPAVNDNIFSMLVTGNLVLGPALTMVNQKAKNLAAANTSNSDERNPFGLTTACLFAANDSLSQIYVQSVRSWIFLENFRRRTANATSDQMVQVLIDAPWNDQLINATGYEVVYSDYVNSFMRCQDINVDLLIAIPTPTSGTIVTNALAESRLRPKSVLGLGYSNMRANSDGMASSNGWIIINPANLSTATYPGSVVKSALMGFTGFSVYASAVPSLMISSTKISVILYMGALDMICGALTATKSLNVTAMRQAFLTLNGKMGLFSAIRFSTLTGINQSPPTNVVSQVINAVSKVVPNTSPDMLVYPYDWPWVRTVAGDMLITKQETTGVLVAIVICVLGAWVSLIVVEQAIFVRRKGGNYRPWLLVTSVALGGVALWCNFFQQSSGLKLVRPDDKSELDVEWSINIAFLAFVPAILLTFIGLSIVMLEIEDTTVNTNSEAARVKAEMRLEREEKRKKAALDNRAHLVHLYQSLTWKSLLGGFFCVLAVMCTRITLMYVWRMPSDFVTVVWAWCITVPVKMILVPMSVHLFFFAIRYRPVAAFLYAAACVGDWQIHVNSAEFRYHPDREFPDILYSTSVSNDVVTIIAGCLAAVTCFVFIGLQFSRMQLSRNGLSVLVASLESVIHQQRRALKDDTTMFSKMKNYIDHQAKVIESINLLTPFSSETSFILATQSSMTSAVRFNAPTHGRRPSTLMKMTKAAHVDRDSVETSVVQSISHANNLVSVSNRSPQIGPMHSNHHITTFNNGFVLGQGAQSPDSGKKKSNEFLEPKNGKSSIIVPSTRRKSVNQIVPLTAELSEQSSTLSASQPDASPKSGVSQATTVTMSEIGSSDSAFLFTRTSITGSMKPSSHSKQATGEMSPLSDEEPQAIAPPPAIKSSPVHHSEEPLMRGSMFGANQHGSSQSINSSTVASPVAAHSKLGRESVAKGGRSSQSVNSTGFLSSSSNSNKSFKVYEEDCISLIEQLSAFKRDNFTVHRVTNSRSSLIGEDEDETSYSFKLPLVLREHISDSQSLPQSACSPSLATLLGHPVCVELIKAELQAIHSTENLMFWLHATRYRRCTSARFRKLLAHNIYEQFIKEGSPQQININTRQRDAITATVQSKRHDDAYTLDMFREAEHEVVLLMETNMMKSFSQTAKYRLCAWICYVIPAHAADLDTCAEFEKAGKARAGKDSLLISSTNESQQSNRSNIERTAYVTRTRASLTHADRDGEQSMNKQAMDVKRTSIVE